MPGTRVGGLAAAVTNKRNYGESFYKKIGKLGGSKGAKDGAIKGFAAMTPELRAEYGRRGGVKSSRAKYAPIKYQHVEDVHDDYWPTKDPVIIDKKAWYKRWVG